VLTKFFFVQISINVNKFKLYKLGLVINFKFYGNIKLSCVESLSVDENLGRTKKLFEHFMRRSLAFLQLTKRGHFFIR